MEAVEPGIAISEHAESGHGIAYTNARFTLVPDNSDVRQTTTCMTMSLPVHARQRDKFDISAGRRMDHLLQELARLLGNPECHGQT